VDRDLRVVSGLRVKGGDSSQKGGARDCDSLSDSPVGTPRPSDSVMRSNKSTGRILNTADREYTCS